MHLCVQNLRASNIPRPGGCSLPTSHLSAQAPYLKRELEHPSEPPSNPHPVAPPARYRAANPPLALFLALRAFALVSSGTGSTQDSPFVHEASRHYPATARLKNTLFSFPVALLGRWLTGTKTMKKKCCADVSERSASPRLLKHRPFPATSLQITCCYQQALEACRQPILSSTNISTLVQQH
jgi:hypothetical protein